MQTHGALFCSRVIIIFAFRATPSVGDGYFWWTLDVLKFDEAFYGNLRQTAAIIAIAAMWIFSKQLTEYSVTKVLFWLAVAGAILSLPNISLFFGLHHWTEETFGFGARTIAVIDAAAASPFAQLSMIPLLTLIAFYAPAGHRATWFALMASLMNMALVAGQLQTKYLNEIFRRPARRLLRAWPAVNYSGGAWFRPACWRYHPVRSAYVIPPRAAGATGESQRRTEAPGARSVREKDRKRRPHKHALGCPSQDELSNTRMSIRSHDENIRVARRYIRVEDLTNAATSSVDGVQDDVYTMTRQMLCEFRA